MNTKIHVGFLTYQNFTQLDLTGPAQILSRVQNVQVHLVGKTAEPVNTDVGFKVIPTTSFNDCPPLNVICIPGARAIGEAVIDAELVSFVRRMGENADYVTSVCNGSLILGAAGLLEGYRSACHWLWRDSLPLFGAIPVNERVVIDRNRLTGGGVTAGIDFGLTLAAQLADEETAKMLQLVFEYDPHPPYDCGSPEKAGAAMVAKVKELMATSYAKSAQQLQSARRTK